MARSSGTSASVCSQAKTKTPRVYIEVGGNALRRTRGGQNLMLPNIWKKLRCAVSIDWRMNTTGMFSDYVLPVAHHFAGLSRLLNDAPKAERVYRALAAGQPEREFPGKQLALLRYVRKLTLAPGEMIEADVGALRDAGCDDGEILEANQVCAYFNYSNRLLNGLGVSTEGDILGLSPPNTGRLDEWEHR